MITSNKTPLLSELAQNHFREKSDDTYEDLIHAIEQEGYTNSAEKFEMLRRVFEPGTRISSDFNASDIRTDA